ncbi:NB-ARC domain-containing protein, partial [Streptomyces sp. NPDC003860]
MNTQDEPDRPPAGISNNFPGQVEGQLVQAGAVHGGITFNYHQAPETRPSRRPNQVPRPPRGFVNRQRVLAELDGLIGPDGPAAGDAAGCPIGVFSGLPGIGKTAVVSQWAHRNEGRFPDGQIFIDFARLRSGAGADVSEALARCLRALGVEEQYLPDTVAERAALYRDRSGERRMLVVLDDVTRPAQVTALLPQGAGSAVLATSTWRLGELVLDGAALLPLDVLDAESALELLSALCGRQRIADEPEAAAGLVELCGGLPLALRICGARLLVHHRLTIASLVAELADEQSRLSRISVSSAHEERTVSAALELAYRDLPDAAARMYRALGHVPGPSFDTAVAAVAAGLGSTAEAQGALDVLETASLLLLTDDRRYALHGLVRLHARDAARAFDPPGTDRETTHRVVGHYLALAGAADRAVRVDRLRIAEPSDPPAAGPFDEAANPARDAISWLEAERTNILAVLRAAAGFGLNRPVWQLAEAFTVLFFHHRHLADWRESLELGAEAARLDGTAAAEARLRSLLSRPLLDLRQ